MLGSFSGLRSRSGSPHHAYSPSDTSSLQEPSVYQGKMHTAAETSTSVDIMLSVSIETVHAITVHQNKMMFQSPIGVMKEVVWDHSEKSVHFVLDDGSTSPTFVFHALTDLEAHFTAILALADLELPPEQIYIGVLIGQNLPSPIQQRRASFGSSQPAVLPMPKRQELLRREQPVRNAMSRERLGLEYIRTGYLCFTCSISGDLRGLTLGVQHIRVFPSPDCHDRSACLFFYSYEHLETCEVAGTRLELRFRTTHQLAKQPSYLVFQSLESQYIREAIWYLKNDTYMDSSLREMLASPTRTPRPSNSEDSQQSPDIAASYRASVLMFFADVEGLKQRIDECCRVIGCEHRVEYSDQSASKPDEASASNVMIHINSGELSHMNPSVRTNPSTSRVLTNGLCEFHTSCFSSAPSEAVSRQRSMLHRDKLVLPTKTMQPLIALLQSTHYAKMFKFQGQLLKRQNARTFHLRKAWHPKFIVLFETPVGGFMCYYDKITHCPGMTDTPKERRVIDLSSVICIRPVSAASPVSRGNNVSTPTMHAFDVVTLYRTWTFAAVEPEEYEVWLHVLTECVEKHATIAPDRVQRFPVKLAMTGQSSPSEATSLEISSHGVSFCTGHEAEVVLNSWYYTELEKWSVVFQQGYTCCLLKCRSPAPASPGSPRTIAGDMIVQDYLFRTAEASDICLAIEFYVGKCMAKLEILAGRYLEESRVQKSKSALVADPVSLKRGASKPKLQLQLVREHPIENVSLAPVGSPERVASSTVEVRQEEEVVTTTLPQIDVVTTERETTVDTLSLIVPFEPITTKDASLNDEPLIDLEDSSQEAGQATQTPPTCSFAQVAGEKRSSFKDQIVTTMVDTPNTMLPLGTMPTVHSKDHIEAQHQVDTSPPESAAEVTLPSQSPESESLPSNDIHMGEFENIDLGEGIVVMASIQVESESDRAETADVSGEHDAEKSSSTAPEMSLALNSEPVCVMQTCSTINKYDGTESSLREQEPAVNIEAVTPEGQLAHVSSLHSEVFKVEFRVDISTQDTCSDDDRSSTTHEGITNATPDSGSVNCSADELGNGQPRPLATILRVNSPPPLLFLEYIPSWSGEPQQMQTEAVNEKESEHPTPQEEEEVEDDRESECGVSEQSDAFNSCASEVELVVPDTGSSCASQSPSPSDTPPPADCSDELFEDAVDLDSNELGTESHQLTIG